MQRCSCYSSLIAALMATNLLVFLCRQHGADSESVPLPLGDWEILDLAASLNRVGVVFQLRPVSKNGPIDEWAFLTATHHNWEHLNFLSKEPGLIREWQGILYCERMGKRDVKDLIEQWGDRCESNPALSCPIL